MKIESKYNIADAGDSVVGVNSFENDQITNIETGGESSGEEDSGSNNYGAEILNDPSFLNAYDFSTG